MTVRLLPPNSNNLKWQRRGQACKESGESWACRHRVGSDLTVAAPPSLLLGEGGLYQA